MIYIGDEHLDDKDARALRLNAAMHAPLWTLNDHDEASDRIAADEQSAESALRLFRRLFGVAVFIAAVAAAWGLAVYFPAWPWLVAALSGRL